MVPSSRTRVLRGENIGFVKLDPLTAVPTVRSSVVQRCSAPLQWFVYALTHSRGSRLVYDDDVFAARSLLARPAGFKGSFQVGLLGGGGSADNAGSERSGRVRSNSLLSGIRRN